MEKTKKGDFVELEFTGYHNGTVFDSNVDQELKKLDSSAKAEKIIAVIGESMVVKGLDRALEEKELGKEYEVHINHKDAFGPRRKELVKTLQLSVFSNHKINPVPGAVFYMDNYLVRVIAVSGARVITDFNNPLSGKDLDYKFKIVRIVDNENEKIESLFKFFFRNIPEYVVSDKILVKGPKHLGYFIEIYSEKFKSLVGKELVFEEIKEVDKKNVSHPEESAK